MKVEERIIEVPAHKERQTVYIACDGLEFADKLECRTYELKIGFQNAPVIKNAIYNAETFEYTEAALFYVEEASDVEIVKAATDSDRWMKCDFSEYGPGWYIWSDQGASCQLTSLLNYKHYVDEWRNGFYYVLDWNQKMLDQAMEKMNVATRE